MEDAMFRSQVPVAGRRSAWLTLGLLALLWPAAAVYAQQPAAAKSPLAYSGDAGMIIHYVKGDKAGEFEMVMGKVKEALNKSDNPERKKQAAGWKLFKTEEPGPSGAVIYMSIMDPVVKDLEYSVVKILTEGFPNDYRTLYESYTQAFVNPPGQVPFHLNTSIDFSK
jgi:hypothetical protein